MEEKSFSNKSCQSVEFVAQRGCGVSIPGDTQDLIGHSSEQAATAYPALSLWVLFVRLWDTP